MIETEDIQKCKKKIILNQPHTESVIGDVANFTTNMKAPLKECKVYFNPIQEGSGNPSPDNVRNIIGWNDVEVNDCGKNLLNISDSEALVYKNYNNFIINKDKSITITKGSFVLFPVPVKSNTTYLYSLTASSNTNHFMMRVQEYSEKPTNIDTGNWLINSGIGNKSSFSFTTNANTTWLLVGFYNNDAYTSNGNQIINNLQLELGSTATSYEPYQGTTTSVNWSDEVGTIYGGYVDLAKGELVATHKFVIYNGQEDGWNTYKVSQQIHFTRIISDKKIKMNSSISNLFPNANNIAFWDRKEYSVFGDHNTLPRIYVNAPYEMPDGVTEWKEWLSANPLQVCYELAEPIHYSLTP